MQHCAGSPLGGPAFDSRLLVSSRTDATGCTSSRFSGWICSQGWMVRRGSSGKGSSRGLHTDRLFKSFSRSLPLESGFSTLCSTATAQVNVSALETMESSSEQEDESFEVFEGLGGPETPVGTCDTRTLAGSLTLEDAMASLNVALDSLRRDPPPSGSGVLRIQVPLPPGVTALQWLQSQPLSRRLLPRSYFSPRLPRGDGSGDSEFTDLDKNLLRGVAGVGSAVLFKGQKAFSLQDWTTLRRYLSTGSPLIRAYGGLRFNADAEPSAEWRNFGSFYFLIPQVELCECETCSLLAVTVVWDVKMGWTFLRAIANTFSALHKVSCNLVVEVSKLPDIVKNKEHVPNEQSWHQGVTDLLAILKASDAEDQDGEAMPFVQRRLLDPSFLDKMSLSKVVMARRTRLEIENTVDPLLLLATLQAKDPSAYQFGIQVPDGTAFVGSTPERLFVRNGLLVASEAVAATRSRGTTRAKDLQTAMNLLLSKKDHNEFEIVRESVKRHLQIVCSRVDVESHKETIKQARVQHLYSRLNGELKNESGEFDLLSLLHPTPAVCGHPQKPARLHIASTEEFDRGMYAGPVGWIGGGGAEFCVGIRSALVKPLGELHRTNKSPSANISGVSENCSVGTFQSPNGASNINQKNTCVYLYAGVGVVKDSTPESEWQELELKISQFETLFKPALPLEEEMNINYVWAKLIVEECCRLGVTYFCIAPGSRSSPLTAAAAANPRATCVTCIDERSLAFHALGYGKGANKPAAIITSSGTAVSNLLPAVVESCQDFVPMLLLTADRPSEMHDAGANQTIDQDKHFGGFVRYHVNLPPPLDNVAARFVLTTIDAAVFRATAVPLGAVHINCQFREPLAGTKEPWNPACLRGLERWVSSRSPFTKYMTSKPGLSAGGFPILNAELKVVADILKGAKRGLIVAGGLQVAAETWAVALLAHHLGWPVVPDVVSGLRLGRTSYVGNEDVKKLVVVHNFDQMLLSNSVYESFTPDVVLQIGGRLTSKRLGSFLERCYPRAYILVEDHSFRQDPSHILTHRIQCPSVEFSSMIRGALSPGEATEYAEWLLELSEMCGREITSQLHAEVSLQEPQIAQLVVASLPVGAGLFVGNSMAIRDVDMYGDATPEHLGDFKSNTQSTIIPEFGIRVAANRGASGIDGVLSTAIGFAVGSNRRVTLLIGDVSFLHDTNGLTLLKPRSGQPPITVVVVNNSGGGIFSMLPIAKTVPTNTFQKFWETSHEVGISKLCLAHSVGHILVETKKELESALQFSQQSRLSWVVEVRSSIKENTQFHRMLATRVLREVTRAHGILLRLKAESATRILDFQIHRYSFPLRAPPTTQTNQNDCVREGFVVRVTLSNGASGVGEVAPLPGLHKENMFVVEEQLRLVAFAIKGVKVLRTLPLLNGHISAWLSKDVGIEPMDLYPSVRCGLEMAVLDALAQSRGCSICNLLLGTQDSVDIDHINSTRSFRDVRICALLEGEGTVEDIAEAAHKYVQQGYCTLKLKVARREDPLEDAAVVKAIRERVGPHVLLRADANRKWSYHKAVIFAKEARDYHLQYLEEPLNDMEDISKFCMETGMAVALDESIDEVDVEQLQKYCVPGVVALIIKPGRVGGFERAASVARFGQSQGIVAVISAAFESGISLSAYAHLAAYLDARRFEAEEQQDSCIQSSELAFAPLAGAIAHGLGTFVWLPDNTNDMIMTTFRVNCTSSGVVTPIPDAPAASGNGLRTDSWGQKLSASNCRTYIRSVERGATTYNFTVFDTASDVPHDSTEKHSTLFFLHGFLGTGRDWLPVVDALAASFRCIAVDLIGHGHTTVDEIAPNENGWRVDSLAGALSELLVSLHATNVVLVGYSMGGRIALYQAMRYSQQVVAAVIVSGSPGLPDRDSRAMRAAQDDDLAETMLAGGIEKFVDFWYSKPLWDSTRARPNFQSLKRKRTEHQDINALAKSLRSLSVGRQESLWDELRKCSVPVLCVVGKSDPKFRKIAHQMQDAHRAGSTFVQGILNPELGFPPKSLSEDDNFFGAWPARNGKDLDILETPSRKSAKTVGNALERLQEDVKDDLSTERQNFLASVQKTISSWGLEDDRGFADFVANEVKKWEREGDSAWTEPVGDGEIRTSRNTPSSGEHEVFLEGLSVLEVDGSGHCVHLDNPLVFVRELRDFVQSLGRVSGGR